MPSPQAFAAGRGRPRLWGGLGVIALLALALWAGPAWPAPAGPRPDPLNPEHVGAPAQAPAQGDNPEDRPAPKPEPWPAPAWPNGALSAARGWLADLGLCPAGPGGWDQAADQALRSFRAKQGLADEGPLNPTDLERLLGARFPAGCRLEITVRPAAASQDPEAAATPPQRRLEMAVTGPGQIPGRVLDLLLPLAVANQNGANPEGASSSPLAEFQAGQGLAPSGRADPATLWALLNTACAPGCLFHLELRAPGPKPGPEPAKAMALEGAGRVRPERMDWQYAPQAGEQVLAVEKVECSATSGDWVIFYRGEVTGVEPGKVRVKLAERFGYRHRPEAAGIDPGDWWCVPRRRHCWSVVKFGDWGGKWAKGETAEFSPAAVFNSRIGVVNAMSTAVGARCAGRESR